MNRNTKMLLGISVALITAASLHWTVGDQFHRNRFGSFDHAGCGNYRDGHDSDLNKKQPQPAPAGKEETPNFQ